MGRVLVIEDSPPLSRIINWILQEAGHDVCSVEAPDEGAKEAASYHPDVVVFNTGIPLGGKAPYIAEIRSAAPAARIIDLAADDGQSAGRTQERAASGEDDGAVKADRYLRVPFHADDLLQAIDELTAEAA